MLEAETECLRSRPMLQDQSAKLGFGRCTHRTLKIGNIGACWNIGIRKLPMSMLSKTVVLLRPPNFHHHRGGWLPSNLTVFSAAFLCAVSWKLSLTILLSSESHRNTASFDPAWMHHDIALLPHASASPLARLGQHDCPAMWRGLCSSHLLLSRRRRSHASKSSDEPCWPRRSQPNVT